MSMVDRKSAANPLTREQQSIVPGAASSNTVSGTHWHSTGAAPSSSLERTTLSMSAA
jgi:hypothetical protein